MDPAELQITSGEEEGRILPLGKETVTLGRTRGNTFVLADETVSRQHAKVFHRDGTHHLVDLRSRHGTLVNGERISRQELHDGDELRLGKTTLLYRLATSAPASAPAAATAPARERDGLTPAGEDPFADERLEPAPPAAPTATTVPSWSRPKASAPGPLRILREDLDQRGRGARLGAILLALAVAAGLGYAAMKLFSLGSPAEDSDTPLENSQPDPRPARPFRR